MGQERGEVSRTNRESPRKSQKSQTEQKGTSARKSPIHENLLLTNESRFLDLPSSRDRRVFLLSRKFAGNTAVAGKLSKP